MKILLVVSLGIVFISCNKNDNYNKKLSVGDSVISTNRIQKMTNKTDSVSTISLKKDNCVGRDQQGNYKNKVIARLRETGKIPQFVEFNGNGNYVVQAYDTEYGLIFGGYVTVNECGEIIDVQVNVDPNNQ